MNWTTDASNTCSTFRPADRHTWNHALKWLVTRIITMYKLTHIKVWTVNTEQDFVCAVHSVVADVTWRWTKWKFYCFNVALSLLNYHLFCIVLWCFMTFKWCLVLVCRFVHFSLGNFYLHLYTHTQTPFTIALFAQLIWTLSFFFLYLLWLALLLTDTTLSRCFCVINIYFVFWPFSFCFTLQSFLSHQISRTKAAK